MDYFLRVSGRGLSRIFFAAMLLLFSSCEKKSGNQYDTFQGYASFRDVPGLTDSEIKAIEALQAKNISLIYGMDDESTEAFYGQNGEIRGFTALFCEYLTRLFEISFRPAVFEWNELITGLQTGDIDFTGELTSTEERRKTYFMTDPIAVRFIKSFRMKGSDPFENIEELRPLRFAFLEDTITAETVLSSLAGWKIEVKYISDHSNVYDMLKSGQIDAFFDENSVEAAFAAYDEIKGEAFLPITYSPVSLATRNPERAPIISVIQKMLQSAPQRYLVEMYTHGEWEFTKQRIELSFSAEEREYISARPVVPFLAEFDNYPKSFYNDHENEWQGMVFDVLREIEALTGISFKIVNKPDTEWINLVKMLQDGKASVISEMIRTKNREADFLWPETALLHDKYALISKSEFPDVSINEILYLKVGLLKESAQANLFKTWFPAHTNIVEYENSFYAFEALERNEIDLIMAGQTHLLALTRYMENPGYKINFFFDRPYESLFGFNKNEEILCSIINKTLQQIDLRKISERWINITYDYRIKVSQSRLPWLIGTSVLLFFVIILLLVLNQKMRSEERRLEHMVKERTADLNKQRILLEYMSMTDQLTGIPNRRNFDDRISQEWRVAIREKRPISILMMDIDKFKTYNDTYGHQQGDVLLQEAAQIITQTIRRPGDFAARWGGEEFVALLSNTDMDGSLQVAESIRANIEKLDIALPNGTVTKVTISIGVSTQKPEPDSSMDTFISAADDALYEAKKMGRNRVCRS